MVCVLFLFFVEVRIYLFFSILDKRLVQSSLSQKLVISRNFFYGVVYMYISPLSRRWNSNKRSLAFGSKIYKISHHVNVEQCLAMI